MQQRKKFVHQLVLLLREILSRALMPFSKSWPRRWTEEKKKVETRTFSSCERRPIDEYSPRVERAVEKKSRRFRSCISLLNRFSFYGTTLVRTRKMTDKEEL